MKQKPKQSRPRAVKPPSSVSPPSKLSASPRKASTALFPSAWSEFLALLLRHRVRFLLVGGHAVASYVRGRFTEDLDIFIDATKPNIERIRRVLREFGYEELAREADQFLRPDRMAFLGRKPLRIDILNQISGVGFRTAWKGKAMLQTPAFAIPVIGLAELLVNKLASGRPKDLNDILTLRHATAPRGKMPATSRSRKLPVKVSAAKLKRRGRS